jgi:hypothetical protein
MAKTVMASGWFRALGDAAAPAMDRFAGAIARDANRMAPRGKTLRLSRSYGWTATTKLARRIGSSLRYGTDVELGTRPHVIRPNPPRKALRFERHVLEGGGFVFARVVHHPGTLAQPHLRLALYTRRAAP